VRLDRSGNMDRFAVAIRKIWNEVGQFELSLLKHNSANANAFSAPETVCLIFS
jgi:hypothetical protein